MFRKFKGQIRKLRRREKKKVSDAKQEVHKPLIPFRDGENVETIQSSLWKVVFDHQETPHILLKEHLIPTSACPIIFVFKLYLYFLKYQITL